MAPYITDLQVFRYLDSLDVHLDLLWIALWKHVLLVEILRHRYKVHTPEAKQNVMTALRDRFKRDQAKLAALDYLESFHDRFWCEADVRVREVTDNFTKKVEAVAEASGQIGFAKLGAKGVVAKEDSSSVRADEALRYQRIVNETQLAWLNKMLDILKEDILAKPQDFVYIVVDDLDLNWADERVANDLIRCLFQTVFELQKVKNLKILVALRTNIFDALDFGPRGGQEEKFRSLVLSMRWTRGDLVDLLDERVKVVGPDYDLEPEARLADILPSPNKRHGQSHRVRPRQNSDAATRRNQLRERVPQPGGREDSSDVGGHQGRGTVVLCQPVESAEGRMEADVSGCRQGTGDLQRRPCSHGPAGVRDAAGRGNALDEPRRLRGSQVANTSGAGDVGARRWRDVVPAIPATDPIAVFGRLRRLRDQQRRPSLLRRRPTSAGQRKPGRPNSVLLHPPCVPHGTRRP